MRADVLRLVRERRYEEALSLLYAARAETPGDVELSASIRQIKEFLIGAYARRLGGLDRVAGPIPASAGRSPDALLVARYVDGASTFEDISRTCPLGRVRTLEVLVELYLGLEPPASPSQEHAPSQLRKVEPVAEPAAAPSDAVVETQRARVDPGVVVQSRPPRVEPAPPPPLPPVPASAAETVDTAFREAFARGTAAFVQRRFSDAVDAFRECERLRPGDAAAATMLRRSLSDGRSG